MLQQCLPLLISPEIRKPQVTDLPLPSAQRYIPSAQHVVPHTVAHGTICCVVSLDCDAPRRGGKQRYDDFLSVVHFRKVVYSNKVGSIRNGNAVITLCFYKSDFNFYWLT